MVWRTGPWPEGGAGKASRCDSVAEEERELAAVSAGQFREPFQWKIRHGQRPRDGRKAGVAKLGTWSGALVPQDL